VASWLPVSQEPRALSRKQLADRLGYSVRTVQELEKRVAAVRAARITTGSASVRYKPGLVQRLLGTS